MKRILLTLSLIANAALLLALASPATFNRIVPFASIGGSTSGEGGSLFSGPLNRLGGSKSPAGTTTTFTSEALLSLDPVDLVARLREAGLPDPLIRAILTAQLGARLGARRVEMLAGHPEVPYWKNPPPGGGLTPGESAELRELSRQNTALIHRLLGPRSHNPLSGIFDAARYGPLPADKLALVQQITQDYNEITAEVRGSTSSVLLPEERERLAFLEVEKEKDLRAVLTPAEFDEFLYRSSNTGNTLRDQLQYFEPTEAEFRTLFALQREFDLKYSPSFRGTNPEMNRERSLAQQKLAADLKAAIDPARLAHYERTTDGNYRSIAQLTSRLDLPRESTAQIWTLQREIQDRANAIRSAPGMSQQARLEQLTSLQTEANTRLSAAFGSPRNFDSYKASSGQWIQFLVPQPNPTP